MTQFSTLAEIAQNSYSETPNSQSINGYIPFTHGFDLDFWEGGTGFTAHAYYSPAVNTMVLSFAGTSPGLDFLTDAQLALTGESNQDSLVFSFASDASNELQQQYGISDAEIIYTGHSLGDTWLKSQVAVTQPQV